MSIDSATAGSLHPHGREAFHRVTIDGPARPLGPKAAALHERRQRQRQNTTNTANRRPHSPGSDVVLTSDDGSVTFVLKVSRFGLYVQRTQRRTLDARVIQSMVFDNNETFVCWCESDPIRFDHPVLYSRLRRHGDEALTTRQ